jgi:hypothetical protein
MPTSILLGSFRSPEPLSNAMATPLTGVPAIPPQSPSAPGTLLRKAFSGRDRRARPFTAPASPCRCNMGALPESSAEPNFNKLSGACPVVCKTTQPLDEGPPSLRTAFAWVTTDVPSGRGLHGKHRSGHTAGARSPSSAAGTRLLREVARLPACPGRARAFRAARCPRATRSAF